jgi:DNA-binding NarL/FixJ family response regulator
MQALVSASRVPDSAISREAHPPDPGKVTHLGDAPRWYRTLECRGRGTSTKGKVPSRVLIADDHELLRTGIRAMLASEPDLEVVGEAKDGAEALALCRELRPELVLMDLSMPNMDGLEATRAIKGAWPKISVLILTAHADQEMLLDAVRAGAAGYVLEGVGPDELVGAVRAILEGELPVDQELVMRLVRRLAYEVGPRTD